jgi:hypothetical protein
MASLNLTLRGGTYYWRKKVTVGRTPVPMAFPLATGSYSRARSIANRLGAAAETLRMSYGEHTGMAPDKLKQVFSDAMRWQLHRILEDQAGSAAPWTDHVAANSIHAAVWDFLKRGGSDARWTPDDHSRLIESGWPKDDAHAVARILFDNQDGRHVSRAQVDSYLRASGVANTRDNVARIERTIYAAREAACREATSRLSDGSEGLEEWVADALVDDAPFAFEQVCMPEDADRSPSTMAAVVESPPAPAPPSPIAVAVTAASQESVEYKKRLLDACEECVAAHAKHGAWSADTIKQTRTALAMFDYACGGGVFIEDLVQGDVSKFTKLCSNLPNRWGRTTAEQTGGIAASLERAEGLPPGEVGISQTTINKHLSWIKAVLDHAAGEDGDAENHRSAVPLLFGKARKGLGKKAAHERKRDRDKRANWTKQEVATLLSAPIWTGAAGIDDRLTPGSTIIHDAWYWMPLMLPLYGGRSAELAGLPLSDVHENDIIPHFQIDYTEDRALKTVQSIRKLPIHPELVRLGMLDYIAQLRAAGCTMLFPELASDRSKSFASTFYKTIFEKLRDWGFPNGTPWRHRVGGAWIDKDTHSFRGFATSMLKGRVTDSVRCDLFGHEGETETERTYDEEADLLVKLDALKLLSPVTKHIEPVLPIRIRSADRLRHGAPRGKRARRNSVNK